MSLADTVREHVYQGRVLDRHGNWVPLEQALRERHETFEHLQRGEIETPQGWVPLATLSPTRHQSVDTHPQTLHQPPPEPARHARAAAPGGSTPPKTVPQTPHISSASATPPTAAPIAGQEKCGWVPIALTQTGVEATVDRTPNTPHCIRVTVRQFVDQSTAAPLRSLLEMVLERKPLGCIVDLSRSTYISSAGWGVFAAAARQFAAGGSLLVLCGATGDVRDSLTLLQLDKILAVFSGCNESLAYLRKTQQPPTPAPQPAQPVQSPASPLPVSEYIRRVIAEYGPLNIRTMRSLLRKPQYGGFSGSFLTLYRALREMNLDTRSKQERYYRSC